MGYGAVVAVGNALLERRADRDRAPGSGSTPTADSTTPVLSAERVGAISGETRARNHHLAELLGCVGRGDRAAFTELYEATSPRVFGVAVRILRNGSIAEEIAQEVYLQVWMLADRYDSALSSPIGWLIMLTHRRAVDRVRADESARGREATYGHIHRGRDHDMVAEVALQHFDEQSVVESLADLTSKQREAIALAFYSDRSYREVAEYLDVPLPTVKTRIRDGLKRLELCLAGSDTP